MGWDVALLLLIALTACGFSWSRWDGVAPLALAFYAMTPDFVYALGPFHRDWMDVFLFHVALDEMLPIALPVLLFLWVVLLVGYVRFRLSWKTASSRKTRNPGSHGANV